MTLFHIVMFNYDISLNNVYGLIYEVFTAGDGGYSRSFVLQIIYLFYVIKNLNILGKNPRSNLA